MWVQSRFTGTARVAHESRPQYTDLSEQDACTEAVISRLQERAGLAQVFSQGGAERLVVAERGAVIL